MVLVSFVPRTLICNINQRFQESRHLDISPHKIQSLLIETSDPSTYLLPRINTPKNYIIMTIMSATSNTAPKQEQGYQQPTKAPASSSSSGTTPSTLVVSSSSRQQQTTNNISIASRAAQPKKNPASIKDRIKMFGGEPSKVQKRMDQLSKKWEKDATKKAATFGVCGRTGKDTFSTPVPLTSPPTKVEWYTSPNSKLFKKRILVC
jgi:hypothetical protein